MSSFPGDDDGGATVVHTPDRPKKTTMKDEIQSTSVGMLDKIFRAGNFVTCGLLITASVLSFLASPGVSTVLLGLYCILFSTILCCFETHLSMVMSLAYRDFGFMFRWQGRILFLLFVASLSYGLGTVIGYVAAAVACFNIIFSTYVLCYHKNYKAHMKKEEQIYRQKHAEMLQKMRVAKTGYETNKQIEKATGVNVAATAVGMAATSGNPAWEKIYDEESGSYYYYNATTKQTSWDPPPSA
eukprot:gb/GEZN01014523.1/.p1 GENE.gb/GEZN01014523.1/~~gb/GEZN01014523.1/.p1  ORF type:complete len:242 (+),score=26.03 gb/GEZN01014523.1/:22-747(+)